MLTDNQLKIKIDILTNKLSAHLFDEVITETKILLKRRSHQMFYNILSIAYQSLGMFDQSAEILHEALEKNSKNPYFLNNMGVTQHKLENFVDAEYYFKKGLDVAPNYVNILNNFANLKRDFNFNDEAIALYKKTLLINDTLIGTRLNLANIYSAMGQFEEAHKHFKKILEIDSSFTEVDRLISNITKYDEENSHLKDMLNKIQDKKLNKTQLMHLHFALGKGLEDIKKYKDSFLNFKKGNEYHSKMIKYNINNDVEYFTNIKKVIRNNENIEIKKNLRKIIFIVGMPRSGTSLVEQIISSHSKVFGGGELPFLTSIINKKIFKNNQLSDPNQNDLKKLLLETQEEYISKISYLDSSDKVFTDKTPLNFMYIGLIKKIFPNSKIVNCNRDPVDVCWSNYKNFFSTNLLFSNDLSDLANYYSLYKDYINFWKESFAGDVYDLEYHRLINKPEDEIKKLLNFCSLEWDDKCLAHENNSRSIKTASLAQARRPIYKSGIKSSDPYRKYLGVLLEKIKD